MTCRTARKLLGRELDGRLDAAEAAALATHLAACADCSAERRAWVATARALRAAGPTAVPAGLARCAYAAALQAPPQPFATWFVSVARPAALAGAVAAAIVWVAAGVPREVPAEARAQDAVELALQVWTAEVGADAP